MNRAVLATNAPESPRFYSVASAARILCMSEMTLYRAIRELQFPAVRIRGRVIIPARALEEMAEVALQTGTVVDAADWVDRSASSTTD
jgi:excisionase family DNA binding protein